MELIYLGLEDEFPPVANALTEPNGLLAVGADLSVNRLIQAYQRGIFPWFSEGDPIMWWSPNPRLVLAPSDIHISKSLAKTLRQKLFEVRFNHDFAGFIRACAEHHQRRETTWITADMQQAYIELATAGRAMSVECYQGFKLVGGLYGVDLPPFFFGESMFSEVADASKVALAHLCQFLADKEYQLIDCQMETPHLLRMGAKTLSRAEFCKLLAKNY